MQQPNKNLFITDELHNFGRQNSKNKVFQEQDTCILQGVGLEVKTRQRRKGRTRSFGASEQVHPPKAATMGPRLQAFCVGVQICTTGMSRTSRTLRLWPALLISCLFLFLPIPCFLGQVLLVIIDSLMLETIMAPLALFSKSPKQSNKPQLQIYTFYCFCFKAFDLLGTRTKSVPLNFH